jgi:hypothetical protein
MPAKSSPRRIGPAGRKITVSVATIPNAILAGGPADQLPQAERLRHITNSETKLKLQRGNRYEHFQRTTETIPHELGELCVFAWTGSTYLAE